MSDAHERFHANAAAYLADVLPDIEASWMDAHAAECKDCADLLSRVRTRLPGLKYEGGHAPVSVLERWAHSPEEFTPLERELVMRHLAECELCRGDAKEMMDLAGIARVVPAPVAARGPSRRALTTALVAAAALAVVFAVRLISWRSPSAPARSNPPSGVPTPNSTGIAPPPPTMVSGASQLIELRERMRGEGADSVVKAVVPPPGTGVRIRVPHLFVRERELLVVRVIRADGAIIWEDSLDARGLERELEPPAPPGGWSAGGYRVEVIPGAGADTVAKRSFEFTLVGRR